MVLQRAFSGHGSFTMAFSGLSSVYDGGGGRRVGLGWGGWGVLITAAEGAKVVAGPRVAHRPRATLGLVADALHSQIADTLAVPPWL